MGDERKKVNNKGIRATGKGDGMAQANKTMAQEKQGLFVGLVTLDLVYQAERLPTSNQKIVAADYTVSAGGPATNAAVTFEHLGGVATILGVLGRHPITQLILADLQQVGVTIADLAPDYPEPPSVSSVIVTAATGERAVVSINAVNNQVTRASIPIDCLQDTDIVLIDGHQMKVGQEVAQQAKSQGIPIVVDGGSWKPGFESVLSLTDYAICSVNFRPPGCENAEDVMAYLSRLGVPQIAITQGDRSIQYREKNRSGWVDVPAIKAVDTLGAGDIFHGAFCFAILQEEFVEALSSAAKIAAYSCQFFGTRRWMSSATSQSKLSGEE
jgi:sugar/nucleoside kinase (ribokinase family)